MSRVRGALLAAALGVACSGCTGSPTRRPPTSFESQSNPAGTSASAPSNSVDPLLDGRVAVRIAAVEGTSRLEVGTARGSLALEARDRAVIEAGGGRWTRRVLEAGPGALEVGGRRYSGSLVVEARPEGGLRVTNLLDLEDYVRGVVAGELSLWSAPESLIEAQAIAARTYALHTLRSRGGAARGAFLWDGTADQVYAGVLAESELPAPARARLERALERSRGLVLTDRGKLLEALYHASCGGRTASLAAVFGRRGSRALTPVVCTGCAVRAEAGDEGVLWSWTAARRDLETLARRHGVGARLDELRVTRVDHHGRWVEVELHGPSGTSELSLVDLRDALGNENLSSGVITDVWPAPGRPISNGVLFSGRGRGHGVGLCQTGALHLAQKGADARAILAHYYPGSAVLDRGSLR